MATTYRILATIFLATCSSGTLTAEPSQLAKQLREVTDEVFPDDARTKALRQSSNQHRALLQQANDKSSAVWRQIKSLDDWQSYRNDRISDLRFHTANWPERPKAIRRFVTDTYHGDGFFIDNLIFESRPNWWVTANLYRPAKPTVAMPGIIISHSHHRPKEHGELQDMGMTWARAGCVVLVPDHLGHGERMQHGFTSSDDFPRDFRVSRQDYYFRYDSSVQLYLAGESLMGWMAWDLSRGVDVLLAHEGVDAKKIIMLGAVAGGGDPCAVTAALDERIDCAVPFNFGGPQPETRFPLPEDIETSFNYAGGGSWESTRNLAFSADSRSRFLPWEIVGSIAPRKLIYAHEFNWDQKRDPVWKRLQRIYELHDAADNLAFTLGHGELSESSDTASHCTHIGKVHRQRIHKALKQWYGIESLEYSKRVESDQLVCWTGELRAKLKPRMLHELLRERATDQWKLARARLGKMSLLEHRRELFADWEADDALVEFELRITDEEALADGAQLFRLRVVVSEPGIESELPALLLMPKTKRGKQCPLVIASAQRGKRAFLQHRSSELAALLDSGIAVFLPDVHGVGELRGGDGRTRTSGDTSRAATALMLGETTLEMQVEEFLLAVSSIRNHPAIDGRNIAFWGESFATVNPQNERLDIPRGIDRRPHQVEPLGPLLAILGAASYSNAPVYVRGGLVSYADALNSPFVYLPLDAIEPGMLRRHDIADMIAALAPRPVRLAAMVNASNRRFSPEEAAKHLVEARKSYAQEKAKEVLTFAAETDSPEIWLIEQLKRP